MTNLDQLDAEQQAVLETLINPDAEDEYKYEVDEDIQRHILGMVLTEREHMVQSMGLIQPHYFINIAHQNIYKVLLAFFEKYRAVPHKFYVRQELAMLAKDEPQRVYFLGELEAIADYYVPGVEDRKYLMDEITQFAKTVAMRLAFGKCTELILSKDRRDNTVWSEVSEILRDAQAVEADFGIGLDYFLNPEDRYATMEEDEVNAERFPTGFESIDMVLNGGLSVGEIGAWIGTPGVGKSLNLTKSAVINLKLGKKVLVISLEMAEDKIAARFDAQLAKTGIGSLIENKNMIINALKDFVSDYEDKRRLVIKQFPSGQADANTVRAYLQQLELYGFKPNLVIVDYIGEMKDIPGMAIHDSRERLIQQLRALGVEHKHCTMTAVQPNRGAREAQEGRKFIDDAQIGDSYNQFRPLDAFWSINQYQQEKDAGIGRLYVVKHRNGKSKYGFPIGYDYELDKCLPDGVGCLDVFEVSDGFYNQKMNEQIEKDQKNTRIDQIPKKKLSRGMNATEEALAKTFGTD